MKVISATVIALLAALPAVQAHMAMTSPPPIDSPDGQTNVNPIVSVSNGNAAFTLCNGQLDARFAAGPVTEWAAGSEQEFVISGGAPHNGGSCQASFSQDGGVTWKAVKTFYGNCPGSGPSSTFKLTVPAEIKTGAAIFGWTWFNKVGNREMYMNCAKINITGAGGSGLAEYSDMFIGNTGENCRFPEGSDPDIPVKGKGEIEPATKPANLAAPIISGCKPAGRNPQDGYVPVAGGGPPAPPAEGGLVKPDEETEVKPKPEENPEVEPKPEENPEVEPKPDVEPEPEVEPKPINLTPVVDEVVTPKPGTGGACTDGEIGCPTETTWTLCANGTPIPMGKVAPGTKCTGNKITKRAAVRFSGAHVARRRVL